MLSVSVFQRVDESVPHVQVLILASTYHRAVRLYEVIGDQGRYMDVKLYLCVGGSNFRDDIRALANGVQIVVGTPGRISSFIRRGQLRVDHLKMFILDRADKLLLPNLRADVYDIYTNLPDRVQNIVFSSTIPSSVLGIVKEFVYDPVIILTKPTFRRIRQFYVKIDEKYNDPLYKVGTLCDIVETLIAADYQIVVFVDNRRSFKEVVERMTEERFSISAMHGEMQQSERDSIMLEFLSGSALVLVKTDFLPFQAIDTQRIPVLINYDMPENLPNYLRRVIRPGSYNQRRIVINFVVGNGKHMEMIDDIRKQYSVQIDELPNDIANL